MKQIELFLLQIIYTRLGAHARDEVRCADGLCPERFVRIFFGSRRARLTKAHGIRNTPKNACNSKAAAAAAHTLQ